jgi:hypothetical protein
MTPDEIRFRIMSQATEDLTGLWELAAAPRAPDLDELIGVLSGLIQERLISVYRGTLFASEETTMAAPAARKEIRNKRFWDWSAPERGAHLRVFATPKGRDWYFAQRKPSADAGMVSG